jgi:hypothetical protein
MVITQYIQYFLVFGSPHGVWLRLADDDVSELFVSYIFKGYFCKLQLTFEDGTDRVPKRPSSANISYTPWGNPKTKKYHSYHSKRLKTW